MRNLTQTYQEKYSIFECGFHSFLGQNRTQFGVKFFIFALVYLLLDLEILLTFPFALSEYVNDIYGLTIALLFIIIITIGFVFELGKSALKIDSRQVITPLNVKSSNVTELIGNFLRDKKEINNIKSTITQMHKRSYNNLKRGNSNLYLIFSFTDISRLYLINKEFFFKYSSIILYVIAILLGISLFMVMFELIIVDWSIYFNISTIVASLVMVYLAYKDKDLLIKLSINSIYVITNMLLLGLILGIFIFLIWGFFLNNNISFIDCFFLSKNIFGVLICLKLVFHIVKLIYDNRKNLKNLIKNLILLILSLIIIGFFFQVFLFTFNVFYIVSLPLLCSDEKNLNNLSEVKILDNSSNNSSEVKIFDNSSNNSSEVNIFDNSLNHHLKKNYPIIVNAKGYYLYTKEGLEILDAASGAAAACIGYGNPQVIEAMTNKLLEGTHYLATSYWKDQDVLNLMKFLVDSTEGQMSRVYLTGSGSDATEAAFKLCRQFYYDQDKETERHIIIARENSYHGNTIGALSASSFAIRKAPYDPILTKNVEYISSCNPYRQLIDGESDAEFVARKAEELENKILEIGPNKIMCFIMEPVSGAALGCVPAVPGYLKAMQEVCHKYDILFVLDEIMCGMGRTGTLHAWQAEGVVPDMFIIGKGLGGGYFPISAVLVTPKVWEALKTLEFIHGLTFDAAPVGAVAALNVHKIIEDNNFIGNVSILGPYLGESLKIKLKDHPNVGDIRGKGFFWGIELVKDKTTKEPFDTNIGIAQSIVNLALSEYNMTIYKGTGGADGLKGDHIMIQPPYNITVKDVDHIVEVVTIVIERVFKEI